MRQALLVHLGDGDLVAFGLGDRDAAVEPVLGDDLRIVGVALAEPADGFAGQLRLRRILEHDMRARLSGRQASRRDADAGLHQVGTLQRKSRDDVAAARMADDVVGLLAELVEKRDGVLHDGVHRVVGVGFRIVRVALAELVEGDGVVPGLEHREVERPGLGGACAVAGAELRAVDHHDAFAFALVEIARADAVDVEPLLLAHIGIGGIVVAVGRGRPFQ